MTPTKKCTGCGEAKTIDQFGRDKHARDGLRNRCKDCIKVANKKSYDANREDRIARSRAWNLAHPERHYALHRAYWARRWFDVMAGHHRRRAERAGVVTEDVNLAALWTGDCGICGGPIDQSVRYPEPDSPSIDHIVPLSAGGPHVADNIHFTHLRCNRIKHSKPLAAVLNRKATP